MASKYAKMAYSKWARAKERGRGDYEDRTVDDPPGLSITLSLPTFACLPLKFTTALPEELEPVPTSQEQVARLQERIATGFLEGGEEMQVAITQEELTSLLALVVIEGEDGELPLARPEVRFLEGEIQLSAMLREPLRLPLRLHLAPRLVEGKPEIQLRKVLLGFVELPWYMLEFCSRAVNYQLRALLDDIQISQMEVGEGTVGFAIRKPESLLAWGFGEKLGEMVSYRSPLLGLEIAFPEGMLEPIEKENEPILKAAGGAHLSLRVVEMEASAEALMERALQAEKGMHPDLNIVSRGEISLGEALRGVQTGVSYRIDGEVEEMLLVAGTFEGRGYLLRFVGPGVVTDPLAELAVQSLLGAIELPRLKTLAK